MKNNDLRSYFSKYWIIPSNADAEFFAAMDQILDAYQEPYESKRSVWCMAEKSFQLDKIKDPSIDKISTNAIETVTIYSFVQPHTGEILYFVAQHDVAIEWAEKIKELVDRVCTEADKIVLVMENSDLHSKGSLYKAFPPKEARRIAQKFEIRYTPNQGSWLNLAEISLSLMSKECINKEIKDLEQVNEAISAWIRSYNESPETVIERLCNELTLIKERELSLI